MVSKLLERVSRLGIENDPEIKKTAVILEHLTRLEKSEKEIANCSNERLDQMTAELLDIAENEFYPLIHKLINQSVSLRVLIEQLERKVIRGLLRPLKSRSSSTVERRINLEDAHGSLLYEIRFLLLNLVLNHPECRIQDPQRVYVKLFPEVEDDIQNTGMLYNLLNKLYTDLSKFLSFETLPESFIPRSMKNNTNQWRNNVTIWDYIREIFKSGKLIRPDTWKAIGQELQSLIKAGEHALVECGNMMRLSDKTDLEEKMKLFHRYSYALAACHVQCLSHFKKQQFALITPYDMKQMVELTIHLDETVSELQRFLRTWMRQLEARTCLHYTVVLQSMENDRD